MHNLIDVPTPDDSHFVGIIYSFKEDGNNYILSVKDQDLMRDHINIKLPGGSNEEWYEDDFTYEDAMFKILDLLGFKEKKALVKVYQSYKKRKKVFGEYEKNQSMLFVVRTMVMESLKNLGYYPTDIEPQVVEFVEKQGHTQYFLEVKEFIDSNGDVVTVPDRSKKFKALDTDVVESRIPLLVSEYGKLIHSHKTAVKKYLLEKVKNNEMTLEETIGLPPEPSEDDDD